MRTTETTIPRFRAEYRGAPDFESLYEAEFDSILRAVYVATGDRALAEEATQEAFVRAYERWRRLRAEPWVTGWVARTAMNYARRQRRRRPAAHESSIPETVEESVDLWRAVHTLPHRQLEAVALYYILDLPVREVARLMDCNEGTVKAHLAKARQSLRMFLSGGD